MNSFSPELFSACFLDGENLWICENSTAHICCMEMWKKKSLITLYGKRACSGEKKRKLLAPNSHTRVGNFLSAGHLVIKEYICAHALRSNLLCCNVLRFRFETPFLLWLNYYNCGFIYAAACSPSPSSSRENRFSSYFHRPKGFRRWIFHANRIRTSNERECWRNCFIPIRAEYLLHIVCARKAAVKIKLAWLFKELAIA